MYSVDLYSRVRRACHVDGMSKSAAARVFNIDRKTVGKILEHAVPPGYRRSKPPARPKLDAFIPIIDQILEADRALPKVRPRTPSVRESGRTRHTASRIFERLRDGEPSCRHAFETDGERLHGQADDRHGRRPGEEAPDA